MLTRASRPTAGARRRMTLAWPRAAKRYTAALAGQQHREGALDRGFLKPEQDGAVPPRRAATLDRTLVRLVLFAVVPLLAATGALIAKVWWEERRSLDASLLQAAASLSASLDRELAASLTLLETLARSPLIDDGDWRRFHGMARESVANRPESFLALFDADAAPIVLTSQPFGVPIADPRKAKTRGPADTPEGELPIGSVAYVRQAAASGAPVFLDLFRGVLAPQPMVGIDFPVYREGRVRYVLSLRFPPWALDAVVRAPEYMRGADAAVVDRRGFFLARRQAPEKAAGKPAPESLRVAIARGETG